MNYLNKAAKQLGGELLRIDYQPLDGANVGECLSNCLTQIEQAGGTHQSGWQIIEMWRHNRCHLLYVQHHHVWRSADGELIDVSPSPQGKMLGFAVKAVFSGKTLFVPADLEWRKTPSGIRVPQANHYVVVHKSKFTTHGIRRWKRAERIIYENPDSFVVGRANFEKAKIE
jgi:hypothetical protein